ncbi:MAG: molybdopterin biosynthesis protein, partial [Rhodobacteraceae bacterium]|nr:molybdopterin biosynthesis protein [Paracoccaceae bacterium]
MKFGEFDVDATAGAILAHSIQTPNGRMRKGIVIGADDIAAL